MNTIIAAIPYIHSIEAQAGSAVQANKSPFHTWLHGLTFSHVVCGLGASQCIPQGGHDPLAHCGCCVRTLVSTLVSKCGKVDMWHILCPVAKGIPR